MDELPRLEDLKNNVDNAIVPTKSAAIMMVVYRTLATIEYKWVDNWMKYMSKLPREAQGVFVNGVRAESYANREMVSNSKGYGEWCVANGWLVDNKWRTK